MSLRNLIKITKVRKASNYEPKWRFKVELLSPAISARLWFDSRLRHNAFRKPGLRTFRLPYHFVVASQMGWEPSIHSACILPPVSCVYRAGPSRREAQCKTWARGPSEMWFYDVIVFSQPCYDRGRAQICSTALTPELSTFANVREEIC